MKDYDSYRMKQQKADTYELRTVDYICYDLPQFVVPTTYMRLKNIK